jgi:hypothetical protein
MVGEKVNVNNRQGNKHLHDGCCVCLLSRAPAGLLPRAGGACSNENVAEICSPNVMHRCPLDSEEAMRWGAHGLQWFWDGNTGQPDLPYPKREIGHSDVASVLPVTLWGPDL